MRNVRTLAYLRVFINFIYEESNRLHRVFYSKDIAFVVFPTVRFSASIF